MSKKQAQVTALVLPGSTSGSDSSQSSNLVKKYLYHWPLFVLGVIITVFAGYYYLKITPATYPITATLKFKTPTSASGAPITITQQDGSLGQLDPVSTPIIVENEIEVMQSKKIIYQIVKSLQLWVNYSQKKGVTSTDLYNKTPINFNFLDTNINLPPAGVSLEVVLKDGNSFLMKDTDGVSKQYKYSTPVKSTYGIWQIDKNPNFDSYIGSPIEIKLRDPDLVSDDYQNGIKVALENKDAPFINLSMSDQVPARGKDVLNSLMALYRQSAAESKNEQTQKILEFISMRVDSLKQVLQDEEQKLAEYKRTHNITDIAAQATSYRDSRAINGRAINDAKVQLSTLNVMEDYANSSSSIEKLPVNNGNLSDPSLVDLYGKLYAMQLERQRLLAITPETSPQVITITQQMNTAKQNFIDKVEAAKTALLANKNQLQSFDTSLKSSLSNIPYQEIEYNALMRDITSKETLYKFLSSKREEIALHFASLIQDSEIVDDAHAGTLKWPKPAIIYALALILGLGAAAGFLYVRESMNDRIISRKQIEEDAEVPILGELSYQDTTESIVVSAGRSKFAIGEQFRVLRTNLYHLHGNNDSGRVTLFTSSVSGEGKSFVSSNLAVTLAYASRKTIILEMDLRKPKVSINFGLSADLPGISNYLDGQTSDLQSLIRPSGIPGLDVLSCGSILPNPSELLGTERLDNMINELKTWYDDIIIDSPPIHLVTDALIISRVAAAALYVVRQGYTFKNELDFISEINKSNRFNKFTIVFNGVKRDATGYYGYGYGYGYYSYNQYNSYATKQKWSIVDNIKGFFKRF